MSRQTRREFLKTTAAASAVFSTFTIAGTKSSGKVLGANDTLRVGICGCGSRGTTAHIPTFTRMDGVEVTYLIDPDSRKFPPAMRAFERYAKNTPKIVQDPRTAIEDKDVDIITVAAPNHWHSLLTIWGCQAGKDVYCEKPLSHNVHEGKIAVETARKFKRIVQHGTQERSSQDLGWQIQGLAKAGTYGKLLVSRGIVYKLRNSIGFKDPSDPPAGLDWNIWLGPAPDQPFHANLHPYNWHWFWDTGCGDIGNQGVHEIDKARWAIEGATLPKSVLSIGGRFGYKDQAQTPNTQVAIFDFGDDKPKLIMEVRGLRSEAFYGQTAGGPGHGNTYHFEKGVVDAAGHFYPDGDVTKPQPVAKVDVKPRGPGGRDHFANFIACVRSRNVEDLNADVLEGFYSASLIHMANTSYKLGEELPFSPRTKAFGDNKFLFETLDRTEAHLTGHGLKLDELKYQVGRQLTVDAAKENFGSDEQANKLLTRAYRAPFTVPDKVT